MTNTSFNSVVSNRILLPPESMLLTFPQACRSGISFGQLSRSCHTPVVTKSCKCYTIYKIPATKNNTVLIYNLKNQQSGVYCPFIFILVLFQHPFSGFQQCSLLVYIGSRYVNLSILCVPHKGGSHSHCITQQTSFFLCVKIYLYALAWLFTLPLTFWVL